MTTTVRRFAALTAQLGTGASVIYTASNVRAQVLAASFTNTNVGAQTVTLHIVPSGGSPSDANMVMKAVSIPAGGSYRAIELVGQALNAGDTIQALASAATSITPVISGAEYTT